MCASKTDATAKQPLSGVTGSGRAQQQEGAGACARLQDCHGGDGEQGGVRLRCQRGGHLGEEHAGDEHVERNLRAPHALACAS